ncbi:MAG: polyprenyl synthetase family protein, partial [Microcella pacifica]
ISAAAQMGVIFSGAPQEYAEPVVVFGEKIGVAFQLIDDVIDLAEPESETGKAQGTDLRSGVATLPLLYLRRAAQSDRGAADLVDRIERHVVAGGTEEELAAAIAELRAHPVTGETLDEARRWADDAVAALAPLPPSQVTKALTKFAEAVVDRSK